MHPRVASLIQDHSEIPGLVGATHPQSGSRRPLRGVNCLEDSAHHALDHARQWVQTLRGTKLFRIILSGRGRVRGCGGRVQATLAPTARSNAEQNFACPWLSERALGTTSGRSSESWTKVHWPLVTTSTTLLRSARSASHIASCKAQVSSSRPCVPKRYSLRCA